MNDKFVDKGTKNLVKLCHPPLNSVKMPEIVSGIMGSLLITF